MLKFPYGISHFPTLREQGYVYLDRTPYIPLLEQVGKQLLFLRPRRFGKSLLVSTLSHYYDLNQAPRFEELFGNLFVGQHPTPEHNQYMVLQWDFSMVSAQGTIEQIKNSLFRHLNEYITAFTRSYAALLKYEMTIYSDDAIASFESLMNVVNDSGYQLYLLIDEYDNFANEVLMHNQGDQKRYLALLEGEGILKTLFKVIKAGASQGSIARVFITGVSPIVMSDMTSGYNVSQNISLNTQFNTLCGITQAELEPLTAQVLADLNQQAKLADVLENMRQFYNGYRFCTSMDQPQLYNPILCFHFLQHYQQEGMAPRNMLDGNLAMDAGRLRYIAHLTNGQVVIDQVLDEENPTTINDLASDFSINNLMRVNQDSDSIVSLLYYFGILTFHGTSEFGGLYLKIPNLIVRGLFLEEIKRQSLPDISTEKTAQSLAQLFYRDANLAPLVEFMEQKYFKVFSNRDYRWSNELTVKTAFASLLFNDLYYIMDSETALERRYSDLVMIVRPNMRQYQGLQDFVLEFKYLGLNELGLSGEQLKHSPANELAHLAPVQLALQTALAQLAHYKTVLINKYQEPQRLHCVAIVALGFERVIWQKLAIVY